MVFIILLLLFLLHLALWNFAMGIRRDCETQANGMKRFKQKYKLIDLMHLIGCLSIVMIIYMLCTFSYYILNFSFMKMILSSFLLFWGAIYIIMPLYTVTSSGKEKRVYTILRYVCFVASIFLLVMQILT